jgi:polygalacturonase
VFKTSYFDNCKQSCERITVSNCVLSSRANAIKFGTESIGDFKYINVNNCVVLNTQHSGIAIESADGANIFGINISNITMCNVANPFFIYLSERLRAPEGTKMGSISNINISNVYADVNDMRFKSIDSWYPDIKEGSDYGTNCSYPSIIMSTNANNKISNVSLRDVNVSVLGGEKIQELCCPTPQDYPECSKFKLPCFGMYAKNVENLRLDNVNFKTQKPDERPAKLIEE